MAGNVKHGLAERDNYRNALEACTIVSELPVSDSMSYYTVRRKTGELHHNVPGPAGIDKEAGATLGYSDAGGGQRYSPVVIGPTVRPQEVATVEAPPAVIQQVPERQISPCAPGQLSYTKTLFFKPVSGMPTTEAEVPTSRFPQIIEPEVGGPGAGQLVSRVFVGSNFDGVDTTTHGYCAYGLNSSGNWIFQNKVHIERLIYERREYSNGNVTELPLIYGHWLMTQYVTVSNCSILWPLTDLKFNTGLGHSYAFLNKRLRFTIAPANTIPPPEAVGAVGAGVGGFSRLFKTGGKPKLAGGEEPTSSIVELTSKSRLILPYMTPGQFPEDGIDYDQDFFGVGNPWDLIPLGIPWVGSGLDIQVTVYGNGFNANLTDFVTNLGGTGVPLDPYDDLNYGTICV